MKKLLTLLVCMVALHCHAAEADYHVVPLPQSIDNVKGDAFVLDETKKIVYQGDDAMARNARFLSEYIAEMTRMQLQVTLADKKNVKGNIVLALDSKITEKEGYCLDITAKGLRITGSTPAGIFYGIQTLRKSLPILKAKEAVTLPAARITDAPRFSYRGMHLDCARHIFSVDFVKRYLDMMALHNMNRFHWHLTEDQGWRIEIKKYPKLAEVAAWRSGTTLGRNSDVDDGIRYGGYYSQADIREIVKYAAERYIEIIPEIDMPGHMLAVLAAYPELGCTGGPYKVGHFWGVYRDILCAGNPKTYSFIKDVLDEVCDLFPSKYIHIGGDEAPKHRWRDCPKCQAMITKQGIKAEGKQNKEDRLQGYFTSEVQKYLASKGRKVIGWDELLECNVDASAAIMSWRGAEPGAEAAAKGHDVVMSPTSHCYFDFYQTKQQHNEPLLIGGELPIEKTYSFEPVPANATPETVAHILGVQANLWTEYIICDDLAEYQVLPRMGALCEVQWMQADKKDYKDFLKRLEPLRKLYELKGYVYARHLWPELYRLESRDL